MNAQRLWMLGGAVVALGILAVAYLFGVQPQLAQASDAQDQTVQAQAQLQQTELALGQLQKEYASIGDLDAQLATLQKSIPGASNASAFVRQLSDQASATQVSVTSITVSEPTAYARQVAAGGAAAPAAAASAAAPAPTSSATPQADSTAQPANGGQAAATASPAPVAANVPAVAPALGTDPSITAANFVLLPVAIAATGDEAKLMDFTHQVQLDGPRLFLVDKIDVKAPSGSTSTAYTANISGYIYVLVGG